MCHAVHRVGVTAQIEVAVGIAQVVGIIVVVTAHQIFAADHRALQLRVFQCRLGVFVFQIQPVDGDQERIGVHRILGRQPPEIAVLPVRPVVGVEDCGGIERHLDIFVDVHVDVAPDIEPVGALLVRFAHRDDGFRVVEPCVQIILCHAAAADELGRDTILRLETAQELAAVIVLIGIFDRIHARSRILDILVAVHRIAAVIAQRFVVEDHVIRRTQVFGLCLGNAERRFVGEIHDALVGFAPPRLDQDDALVGIRTVEEPRRGIFENRDPLDLIGVEHVAQRGHRIRTVAHQTVDQNGVTHAADVLRAEHAESFGLQHAVQTVIAEFILIAVHIDVVDRTDHAAVGQCPERQFNPVGAAAAIRRSFECDRLSGGQIGQIDLLRFVPLGLDQNVIGRTALHAECAVGVRTGEIGALHSRNQRSGNRNPGRIDHLPRHDGNLLLRLFRLFLGRQFRREPGEQQQKYEYVCSFIHNGFI